MRKLTKNIVFLFFISVNLSLLDGRPQAPVNSPKAVRITFGDLIGEIGRKHDCYFTIEASGETGSEPRLLKAVQLPLGDSVASVLKGKTLGDSLRWVKRLKPKLEYIRTKEWPCIIHIGDSELRRSNTYALDKVIDFKGFRGRLAYLPDTIGKQGLPVASKTFGDTRELMVSDYSTEVQIPTGKFKVRDLLTNFVTLEKRGRILWIAETERGKKTYVRFHI